MFEKGEIDALISAYVPKCVLEKSPRVGRLFEDYESVERDYFRRTGIFPMMHTVVVGLEFAQSRPDVVRAIYDGFCAAKDMAMEGYTTGMVFNKYGDDVAVGEQAGGCGRCWGRIGGRMGWRLIGRQLTRFCGIISSRGFLRDCGGVRRFLCRG